MTKKVVAHHMTRGATDVKSGVKDCLKQRPMSRNLELRGSPSSGAQAKGRRRGCGAPSRPWESATALGRSTPPPKAADVGVVDCKQRRYCIRKRRSRQSVPRLLLLLHRRRRVGRGRFWAPQGRCRRCSLPTSSKCPQDSSAEGRWRVSAQGGLW
jgi:hypothetical protein